MLVEYIGPTLVAKGVRLESQAAAEGCVNELLVSAESPRALLVSSLTGT